MMQLLVMVPLIALAWCWGQAVAPMKTGQDRLMVGDGGHILADREGNLHRVNRSAVHREWTRQHEAALAEDRKRMRRLRKRRETKS